MFEVSGLILVIIGLMGVIINKLKLKQLLSLTLMALGVVLYLVGKGAEVGEGPPLRDFTNPVDPIPSVLMLTTLVVDVAVTGLALSFLKEGEE
ncbi:cation:proton antiporter subunit C [Pyrococcus horikoshii]|uniref:Cation:proton antiporter subunit C n=1 Tax=Pyrococcus horikoshii TaxID=53953 RepID=A0A832WJD8_PYRHR|nr:cation:proton antiporter subunit C [Pyrococcus horikoshii]HII61207.1 cation:proton antiporter subunit C [Pyrococcus horikoshii]